MNLKNRRNALYKLIIPESVRGLIGDAIGVLLIKLFKMLGGIGLSIYIGRFLGVKELGLFEYSLVFLQIVVFFIASGLNNSLIKAVAIRNAKNDLSGINSDLLSGLVIVLLFGTPISLVGIIWSSEISEYLFDNDQFTVPFFWASVSIIPQAMIMVFGGVLNGMGKIAFSQFLQEPLKIFLGVGLLLLFWFFFGSPSLNHVVILYGVSALLSLVIGSVALRKALTISIPDYTSLNRVFRQSLPFILISATSMLSSNIDKLMLGWLATAADVGIYTASAKVALMSNFLIASVAAGFAPRVSRLYANLEYEEIKVQYIRMAQLLGVVGFALLLCFVFFGRPILGLWGVEFVAGYGVLVVLSTGQFINLLTGASHVLLSYTGHERWLARLALIFLVLNVVLNFVLIHSYGVLGAALATGISYIFNSIVVISVVNRKTELTVRIMDFLKWNQGD